MPEDSSGVKNATIIGAIATLGEGDFTVLHNSHYRAQNASCIE